MTRFILSVGIVCGLFTTTADAGKFKLGQVIRTVNQIDRAVQGRPIQGRPDHGRPIKRQPIKRGPIYGGPIHKVPEICPPPRPRPKPICKPKPISPPIVRPLPPICERPRPKPPVCKRPICKRPQKVFTMTLTNQAGADIFISLNKGDYQAVTDGDFVTENSKSPKPVLLEYDYGNGLVQEQLDPAGSYAMEWVGDDLVLIDLDAPVAGFASNN